MSTKLETLTTFALIIGATYTYYNPEKVKTYLYDLLLSDPNLLILWGTIIAIVYRKSILSFLGDGKKKPT